MPPHYNARRQYDQPIPSLNVSVASDASDTDDNASSMAEQNVNDEQFVETDNEIDDFVDELTVEAQSSDVHNTELENMASNDENEIVTAEQSTIVTESHDENGTIATNDENEIGTTERSTGVAELHGANENYGDENNGDFNSVDDTEFNVDVSQPDNGTENNVKHILMPVNMDEEDELAIRSLFGDQEMPVEANDNDNTSADSIGTISLACDETATIVDGKIAVTRKLAEGLEMTYIFGETPTPLAPMYAVKINDSISGNIPFHENEEKDRAYLVKIDKRFEEFKMAKLLLVGLKCLNCGENRKKSGLDYAFVKALIIALCTSKAIKNGMKIHKDLKIFIKGLNIFVNSIYY